MTDRAPSPALTALRAATDGLHAALDARMMALAPFDSLAGYGALLRVNAAFLATVAPLFHAPALERLIPGLPAHDRHPAAQADLGDLGLAPLPMPQGPDPQDMPAALGWLYVAEGSRLGAAVLSRGVARLGLTPTYGARHLAPGAGRWAAFVAALDAALPDAASRQRAGIGACAAFTAVQALADRVAAAG